MKLDIRITVVLSVAFAILGYIYPEEWIALVAVVLGGISLGVATRNIYFLYGVSFFGLAAGVIFNLSH